METTVFCFLLAMAAEAAFILLYVKRPIIVQSTPPPPQPSWECLQIVKRTFPSDCYDPVSVSVCLYQEKGKKFVGVGAESDSKWIYWYGDRLSYVEAKQWFPDLKMEEYGG